MKRKIISLKTKILDCLRNNEKIINLAKFYSMNESTIKQKEAETSAMSQKILDENVEKWVAGSGTR